MKNKLLNFNYHKTWSHYTMLYWQKEQKDLHRDKVSFVIQSLNQISTMTTQ